MMCYGSGMDRRNFNRVCSGLLAGAAGLSAGVGSKAAIARDYARARLMFSNGSPVRADALDIGSSHVFSYPYVATPCFLLRLNPGVTGSNTLADQHGNEYQWQGAAGEDASIVAFSAICTHKMTHPAKPISHLNFRPENKTVHLRDGSKSERKQLIYCCSEHSVYDPARGAEVLRGPATQPLAAIRLEVDDDGGLVATGSYGGDMYAPFLAKFGFRQALERGLSDPEQQVGNETQVTLASEYSNQQILC